MRKGTCSSCDSPIDGAHPNYCRYCFAHFQRESRKNDTVRLKTLARATAMRRYKAGIIVREDYRGCGSPDSEMHHPDYSKPKEVTWLCKKCHSDFHVLERRVLCA